MFTGDRSGDWLFGALHRAGFATQPTSTHRSDGLELRDTWLTAAVRCAPPGNRPSTGERDECRPFLERELELLADLRVYVCLGGFAYDQLLRILRDRGEAVPRPKPKFAHGLEVPVGEGHILCSYHPSQQNTFTGRLTEPMFDSVWSRALELIGR
jgi:uracil-DNA glycosylase